MIGRMLGIADAKVDAERSGAQLLEEGAEVFGQARDEVLPSPHRSGNVPVSAAISSTVRAASPSGFSHLTANPNGTSVTTSRRLRREHEDAVIRPKRASAAAGQSAR